MCFITNDSRSNIYDQDFIKNSFHDLYPYNKSNNQTTAKPVSLNLSNYTDNVDLILLQLSIKSNMSGKQNIIKVLQISKHIMFFPSPKFKDFNRIVPAY